MGPPVDPVRADTALPGSVEVVVIGGGIVGTSTALALAKRGISVALCEKGHIAGEQSSRNWGWVRKGRRDPREMPLIVESLRLWEGMNEAVEGETGFRTTGIVWSCEDDADVARYEAWLEHARPYQIDARMISGAELDRHVPGGAKRWKAAMYCATDGRAEPQKAAPAIATAAQRAGAVIATGCAVRGLDRAGGRVSAVVTERGRIRCNAVVLAGGAWSRRFLADVDITLKQLKVRSSALRTAPLEGGPEDAFWCAKGAYRKRLDGGYSIAQGSVNIVPLVPDSFRYFGDFLPAFKEDWRGLKLRVDGRFRQEWIEARPVPLDQVSPYERCRVLPPLWLREIAGALKAHLGEKAAKVSTREAPDWLLRAVGLFNHDARFMAADIGKRRTYVSAEAEALLGRPLRSLGEAVVAAGESLIAYGLA